MTIKLPNPTVCFQFLLLFVCFHCAVWHWILVPQPGIKVQNPNHLTAREVLQESVFSFKFLSISPLHPTTALALPHECMFLGSLSRHNKDLERRTLKPSAQFSGLGQTVLELLGKSVLSLYFI